MIPLPADLREQLGACDWQPVTIGQSGAATYRLQAPAGTCTYLKVVELGNQFPLQPEAERLRWLQGRLLVPKLLSYQVAAGREYLWSSELPGRHGEEPAWQEELPGLVRLLAEGLRAIHSLADCPFDRRLAVRIAEAQRNVERGWVDETDFDEVRQGRTARELFAELLATVPPNEDLVFTHGDYSLPNVVVDGELVGFVDWGNAGLADRYQDLAVMFRSLERNFGPGWGERFLEAYGLTDPDWRKIEFYQLLDEFF